MVTIALAPARNHSQPTAKRPPIKPNNIVPRIALKPSTNIPKTSTTKAIPSALSPVASAGSPLSAASPAASSPAASSPAASASSPGVIPKISTSKVWVLPPRPKPGRKPSVDTPQNKRKAQNRAAQRAFRERRAAMVGELEEKLDDVKKERDAREARLETQLKQMIRENEDLKRSLRDLHLQMAKQNSGYQMASPAMSAHESPMDILDRVLEERLPVPVQVPEDKSTGGAATASCTVCIKDDCICESVGIKQASSSHKRAQSDEPFEIDFTEMFARPTKKQSITTKTIIPPVTLPPSHRTSNTRATVLKPPADRCGFCSDGTPCMCAEAEANEENNTSHIDDIEEDNTLPPIVLNNNIWSSSYQNTKLPALHPGPSREIAPQVPQQTVSLPNVSTANSSSSTTPTTTNYECTGNPGTCMQCQTDPMSTLFCTTLASRPNTNTNNSPISKPLSTPDSNGSFISASAAYRTLSRHKDFRRADFGALVGKLNTRGMQVEVNSVANVLRELDRRLYS